MEKKHFSVKKSLECAENFVEEHKAFCDALCKKPRFFVYVLGAIIVLSFFLGLFEVISKQLMVGIFFAGLIAAFFFISIVQGARYLCLFEFYKNNHMTLISFYFSPRFLIARLLSFNFLPLFVLLWMHEDGLLLDNDFSWMITVPIFLCLTILQTRVQFAPLIIIDKRTSLLTALVGSWRLTKGVSYWQLWQLMYNERFPAHHLIAELRDVCAYRMLQAQNKN